MGTRQSSAHAATTWERCQDAGAAYIFTRSGGVWTLQQRLTADVPASNDRFGSAVDISGDTAIVGAPSHFSSGRTGVAVVFTRTAGVWVQSQELTGTDVFDDNNFGQAVAVDGDTALVASMGHGTPGNAAGAVFAFTRSAGMFGTPQILTGTDVVNAEYFGTSIALDGDTAVVGAFRHNHNYSGYPAGPGSGGAFVFTRTADVWSQSQELTVTATHYPDPVDYLNSGDGFGSAVALSDDTAMVGARSHYVLGQPMGAAYVYTRNGGEWTQQQRLKPSDGAGNDYFGRSLALDGDAALIGSPLHNHTTTSQSGACYLFLRSGGVWAQGAEFTPVGVLANDQFGSAVALSSDSALLGAWGHALGGHSQAGTAYVFLRSALEALVDTTPPAPPAHLKVVAGYRSATLTWTNPSAGLHGDAHLPLDYAVFLFGDRYRRPVNHVLGQEHQVQGHAAHLGQALLLHAVRQG